MIGGCDDKLEENEDEVGQTVEKYDPSTNQWSYVRDLNIGRFNHAACLFEDKFYVVGGRNRDRSKSIECYDPTLDQWSIVGETDRYLAYNAVVEI